MTLNNETGKLVIVIDRKSKLHIKTGRGGERGVRRFREIEAGR
jgi:hypothetical protein